MLKIVDWAPEISKEGQDLLNEALPFVEKLVTRFSDRINDRLIARKSESIKNFQLYEYPDDWKVFNIPNDLLTRTVEITGPPSRKMVINALNSCADCYMADFEDSLSPTWTNLIDGQVNLRDAVDGSISIYDVKKNKDYRLNEEHAVLMVRPRGLHLKEAHVELNDSTLAVGQIPACLFDFGLYVYTNCITLHNKRTAPYFYIPKLESAAEAKLWDDIFSFTEDLLGMYAGTIKCTVLIETLPAVFQMDEILCNLREHIVGLNCGRWDYIFSCIKNQPKQIYPDRDQVGMNQHAMKSYVDLLIQTCHRRGAFAMGGMAAQIPIKNDPDANEKAMNIVHLDKRREAIAGHDGTWVAHPGLLHTAKQAFVLTMGLDASNQLHVENHVDVTTEDLLEPASGSISFACVKTNVEVCMKYMEAWLAGNGCVPMNNLMEDAATAEICRAQLWQWVHNDCETVDTFQKITLELIKRLIDNVKINDPRPGKMLYEMTANKQLEEFLTLRAYDELIKEEKENKANV